MKPTRILATVVSLSLLVAAGPAASALPKPVAPPAPTGGGQGQGFGDLPDSKRPIDYKSLEGQFTTTFPSGCARLHTKMNVGQDGSTDVDVRVVFVNCDRWERTGEGCFVNAHVGVLAGLEGQKAVDVVLQEIRELMQGYEVAPTRQTPLSRDFGEHGRIEGLEVLAKAQSGEGEVWIRGFRRGDDIYLLMAWNSAGGLFSDPEYAVFFDAFRPWADAQ